MRGIGGNTTATIELKTTSQSAIGEEIETWEAIQTLTGWIDLITADNTNERYAFVKDSTNVFIGDYVKLDDRITEENSRLVSNGKIYNIMYIDNPQNRNLQLEIYLRQTNWCNSGNSNAK